MILGNFYIANKTQPLSIRANNAEFINNTNNALSFKGYTNDLSKIAYSDSNEMEEIIEKVQNSTKTYAIANSIPDEWVQKIPKANRKEIINELYKDLGEIFSKLRENQDTNQASVGINQALHKANILTEDQNVSLTQLSSTGGAYGIAYLLKEDFKQQGCRYVFKLYEKKNNIARINGNYIESNRGLFWRKNVEDPCRVNSKQEKPLNKTQRTKFYFTDLKNEYMLENSAYMPKPKRIVPPEIYGLTPRDEVGTDNIINGYAYDYGGNFWN